MSFKLIKAMLAEKKAERAEKKRLKIPRQDTELPFDLQIGGMVTFTETAFIMHESEGGVVSSPGGCRSITAWGKMSLGDGLTMHRFYLDGTGDYVLRVIVDKKGVVVEDDGLVLLQEKEQHMLSDEETLDRWLGKWNKKHTKIKEPGLIGWETFGLGEKEDPLYFRSVDSEIVNEEPADDEQYMATPYIEPMMYTEYLRMDPRGESEQIERSMMIYSRWLSDESDACEHCTISAFTGTGVYSGYAEVHVGLSLDESDISEILPDAE